MSNETQNVFERKAEQPTLADDRKTRFNKKDEARRAARIASDTQDQREQARENQRATWTHRSDAPRTSGGITAGTELAALKAASDADRTREKQLPRVIYLSALYACTRVWRLETEHGQQFFDDDFNWRSLNNAVQTHIGNGGDVCIEMVEAAYQDVLAGNHLMLPYTRDPANGGRVTSRGAKPITPPTLYPAYRWPDEIAIAEREAEQAKHQANSEEAQRALALTFAELQAEVRKAFKSTAAGVTNVGERIR